MMSVALLPMVDIPRASHSNFTAVYDCASQYAKSLGMSAGEAVAAGAGAGCAAGFAKEASISSRTRVLNSERYSVKVARNCN